MTPAACGTTTAANRYSRHYLATSTLRISNSRRTIRIWTDNLRTLISPIGNSVGWSFVLPADRRFEIRRHQSNYFCDRLDVLAIPRASKRTTIINPTKINSCPLSSCGIANIREFIVILVTWFFPDETPNCFSRDRRKMDFRLRVSRSPTGDSVLASVPLWRLQRAVVTA